MYTSPCGASPVWGPIAFQDAWIAWSSNLFDVGISSGAEPGSGRGNDKIRNKKTRGLASISRRLDAGLLDTGLFFEF